MHLERQRCGSASAWHGYDDADVVHDNGDADAGGNDVDDEDDDGDDDDDDDDDGGDGHDDDDDRRVNVGI